MGRLASPSLFRLRYFQKARYVIIRVSSYGYEQRSDRRTHDDAAASPQTSCLKTMMLTSLQADTVTNTVLNTLNVAKPSCMRRNWAVCPAPELNEWMDAAQHQQLFSRGAHVNPHVLASAALRLRFGVTPALPCVSPIHHITRSILLKPSRKHFIDYCNIINAKYTVYYGLCINYVLRT